MHQLRAGPNVDPERRKVFAGLLFIVIAGLFGFIHMYHVSSLFENDHHFSHLSTIEREMTFRTEMGMYFSYYKRLVEAPTYLRGIYELMHDNVTEYPNVINTLQRFNLLPEVLIAFTYRSYLHIMALMNLQTKECWQIIRSPVLPLITSCEGLGDPIYFYLNIVWLSAGLTVVLLFTFGTFLSDSILGGLLTVMCYFYNHAEATRVQWAPPLRESFAYPFILLHILFTVYIIKADQETVVLGRKNCDCKLQNFIEKFAVFSSTTMCLLTWQFSQLVLSVQLLAVFALYVFKLISIDLILNILKASLVAHIFTALVQTGTEHLLGSLFSSLSIGMLMSVVSLDTCLDNYSIFCRATLYGVGTIVMACTARFRWRLVFPNQDDDHVYNILDSKFGDYKDFHTLLYTCSAEFDYLPIQSLRNLWASLLIPTVVMVVMLVVYHWIRASMRANPILDRNRRARQLGIQRANVELNPLRFVEPHIGYILILLGAFTMMAMMIMRLKLFFTPHLCIVVSILACRKYMHMENNEKLHLLMMAVLLTLMSFQGVQNIKEQHNILGEYLNLPFEELLNWIKTETETTAVFAGPMSLMANVMLSTGRPIVNHPHYENHELRERTKKVYSVFSRKRPQEVFNILASLKVDYVVLDQSWCYRVSRKGCSMTDLWDLEDPANKSKAPLCPHLYESKFPLPFQRVFANDVYVVLQVHYKVVEFRPRHEYKE